MINQASGTYTKLPALGQVIAQGQVLYRVDDSPVVLLYGSTPAYRTLSAGAAGADVAEFLDRVQDRSHSGTVWRTHHQGFTRVSPWQTFA